MDKFKEMSKDQNMVENSLLCSDRLVETRNQNKLQQKIIRRLIKLFFENIYF